MGVLVLCSCHVFLFNDFTVTNKIGNNTATEGPEDARRRGDTDGRPIQRTERKTFKRNVKSLNFNKLFTYRLQYSYFV